MKCTVKVWSGEKGIGKKRRENMAKTDKGSKQKYERKPPQAIELESAVVGALLLDNSKIDVISGWLPPRYMYKEANKLVYQAILNLWRKRGVADILTVPGELKAMGKLDDAGGAYYVAELSEMVSSVAGLEHYAKIVWECAQRRAVIDRCTEAIDDAYKPESNGGVMADELAGEFLKIGLANPDAAGDGIFDAMAAVEARIKMVDRWRGLLDGELPGVSYGFQDLDGMTAGMMGGQLIVVGAYPGQGKTSFALGAARSAAKRGTPVGFFSFESTIGMIMNRMVAQEARVGTHFRQVRQYWDDDKEKRVCRAEGIISDLPMWFDEVSFRTVDCIRSMRRLKREYDIGIFIIDYFQRMSLKRFENEEISIRIALKELKDCAKELNVPVMVLSQLSRYSSKDKKIPDPRINDLKGSGAWEAEADAILLIHRPWEFQSESYKRDLKKEDEEEWRKQRAYVELKLAKVRDGITGLQPCVFVHEYTSFEESMPDEMPF